MVLNQPFLGVPAQTYSRPTKEDSWNRPSFPRRTGPSRTDAARLPSSACGPHPDGKHDAPPPVCWNRPLSRGATVDRIRLREYAIHPCIGCGYIVPHGALRLDGDDVADLFRRMEHAGQPHPEHPRLFLLAPALLKGFIDRAIDFWEQRREGTAHAAVRRPNPCRFARHVRGRQALRSTS